MLNVRSEKIGDVAVVHCQGRIVRSDAAFRLRDAVTQQRDARVVLLDLSEVESVEGGGLGMLVFLQRWTRDHNIQFKLLDPPDPVRKRLERASSIARLAMASTKEVLSLLCSDKADGGTASQEDRDTMMNILMVLAEQ